MVTVEPPGPVFPVTFVVENATDLAQVVQGGIGRSSAVGNARVRPVKLQLPTCGDRRDAAAGELHQGVAVDVQRAGERGEGRAGDVERRQVFRAS